MTTATQTWVWNKLLDAELNKRYWLYMAWRYKSRDLRARILLAVTSSGVVAGLTLWQQYPQIWQVLSGVSALVAIALPILNYPARVETASDLRGRWTEMVSEYDQLWITAQSGPSPLDQSRVDALTKKETSAAQVEAKLPYNEKLARRCQAEVIKRRGLTK